MSMNQSTAGLRVLRHVIGMTLKQAVDALSKAQPFLTYDEDKKALDIVRHHITTYSALPHPDTILDKATVFLPEVTEPYEYDFAQLRNRFVEDHMREASDEASSLIMDGNAVEALNKMLGRLLPLTQDHGGLNLFDFRHTETSGLHHYKMQLEGKAPPVQTLGLPTLDAQGGIEDGDMIGIIGRPQSGKTWLMLMLALEYWATYQEPLLFVTQEMSAKQIEKRALPLVAGVDPTPMYKGKAIQYQVNGLTPSEYLARLEAAAQMMAGGAAPFLIYDSKMAGTVSDIDGIMSMHGIRTAFVDGAYMLRHPDTRLGRYARVPENLDLMKGVCQRTGRRFVSSWQFKRGAGKDTTDGTEPELDDIGYSHAIGEYMGVILGLLENPKSVAQLNKKKVNIMKGRNGEVGNFTIHWDFSTMNFKEVTAEETEADLTYL